MRESESFTVKLYVGISVIRIICSFQTGIQVDNATLGKKNKIRFFSVVSLQVTKGSMSIIEFFMIALFGNTNWYGWNFIGISFTRISYCDMPTAN